LWLAESSQQPISQTTWLKVTPHCNHYGLSVSFCRCTHRRGTTQVVGRLKRPARIASTRAKSVPCIEPLLQNTHMQIQAVDTHTHTHVQDLTHKEAAAVRIPTSIRFNTSMALRPEPFAKRATLEGSCNIFTCVVSSSLSVMDSVCVCVSAHAHLCECAASNTTCRPLPVMDSVCVCACVSACDNLC